MEEWFIVANIKWFLEHAHRESEDSSRYLCNESGEAMIMTEIGRSIHVGPFEGAGFGEVRPIQHLWCPHCMAESDLPEYRKPIHEDEITNSPSEVVAQVKNILPGATSQNKKNRFSWLKKLIKI